MHSDQGHVQMRLQAETVFRCSGVWGVLHTNVLQVGSGFILKTSGARRVVLFVFDEASMIGAAIRLCPRTPPAQVGLRVPLAPKAEGAR